MKIINKYPIQKIDRQVKVFKSKQTDDLTNLITSMGSGSDRLGQTFFGMNNIGGNYQEAANIYEGWLGRRIVDLPVKESLKKGYDFFCPSWEPEKIKLLEAYCNHLNLNNTLASALKSERIFGGSIIIGITDATWGAMRNPIPDFLPSKTLLCLRMFDAWQAYAAMVNFMNPIAKDFLYPINYTIGSAGLTAFKQGNGHSDFLTGAIVDRSRVERFEGEDLPWYERQRNLYWGQSILNSAYGAIRNAGIVDNSIASLIFRASVPVFQVEDLINIVADEESRQSFLQRMNLLNYQMSNNNMAIIDKNELLNNLELGSLANLDSILERFYVTVSSATGIPVTKLVGTSAKGLDATGEGDMNNYYDMLEEYQSTRIKPHLMSILKHWIIPSFFDELMPEDFDVIFPPIERETQKMKQEKDTLFIDMLIKSIDSKLIDVKTARKEIIEREIYNNFTKKEAELMETEHAENEVELNEALDAADKIYNKDEVFGIIHPEDYPGFDVHENKEQLKRQNGIKALEQPAEAIKKSNKRRLRVKHNYNVKPNAITQTMNTFGGQGEEELD